MAETEEVEQLRRRARRRLVGAAAVVLFLVVVPPMLMDLEQRPVSSNLSVEIPAPAPVRTDARTTIAQRDVTAPGKEGPVGGDSSRDTPVPGRDAARDSPIPGKDASKDAPITGGDGSRDAPVSGKDGSRDAPVTGKDGSRDASVTGKDGSRDTPVPARDGSRELPVTPAPQGAAPGEAVDVAWFVPLGTFAARDNAQQLVRRAGQLGVKVLAESVNTAKGARTRVRAGPYRSREEAEKVRSQLREAGIDASAVAAVRHGEKRG